MQNIIPPDDPQYNSAYTKRCHKCHLYLPFKSFDIMRSTNDGLHIYCKKCRSMINKKQKSPEKTRDRNYRTNYGISLNKYNRMLEQQSGVCKCCGNTETRTSVGRNAQKYTESGKVIPLAVDHDHTTGDVRALLCHACNAALGHMEEDPERIQKLKEYAEWCQTREPDTKIIQMRLID